MSDVTLSKAVRSNLLHLQNTAKMMDTTQERLATGKKVNSALDNPTNFFTSQALNARAADIGALLDAMSNGIQTIEMADNGLTAITDTLESMQSTLRQARQDNTFQMATYGLDLGATPAGDERLTLEGGAIGTPAVEVGLTKAHANVTGGTAFGTFAADSDADGVADAGIQFDIALNGGTATTISISTDELNFAFDSGRVDDLAAITDQEMVTLINAKLKAAGVEAVASTDGTNISFEATYAAARNTDTGTIAITDGTGGDATDLGFAGTGAETPIYSHSQKTVDSLVSEINANYKGLVRASNDRGQLRIENLSTQPLTVGTDDGTGSVALDGPEEIDGNTQRASLADQFNALRSELDRLAEDASYNGVNLLRGDDLKIIFNEMGTSRIEIQAKDAHGNPRPINSNELGLLEIADIDLDNDESVDALLQKVQLALGQVRAQASDLGSTLSVVQNREKFTKEMINTLQSGAANLVLADSNEEAANMLALQTRQQLSQTALSLASQADQAVLRLFG